MKTLFLLPTLEYSGASRQAQLLAPRLVRSGHEVHVLALGAAGPWASELSRQGIPTLALNWTRRLDPIPLWRLRRCLHQIQPDRILAWNLTTLRSLGLVGRQFLSKTLAHRLTAHLPLESTALGRLDRWLVQCLSGIVAAGPNEREVLLKMGIPGTKIQVQPPMVELLPEAQTAQFSSAEAPPTLAFLGRLEKNSGARDAIWATDILAHLHPRLTLQIIGAGPESAALRSFAAKVYHPNRSRLLGPVADPAPLLACAALCLIPTQSRSGIQVALEAQAAGCPVLAFDHPHLRDVIEDGSTGHLVPAGDLVALARRAQHLIQNPSQRLALAARARQRVAERLVQN